MAGALDLDRCARELVRIGLVTVADVVRVSQRLTSLTGRADKPTLVAIASLLLKADPPPWLLIATSEGTVLHEYIPSDDLRDLKWLDPFLDRIILEVAVCRDRDTLRPLRAGLGRAGELVVLASLEAAGLPALHVADVSDSYGYDIETTGAHKQRLEVKSTTSANSGTFHITRNEYNVCRQFRNEWRVVQVTFESAVMSDPVITACHVLAISELASEHLAGLVPADSATFRWTESAIVRPPAKFWVPSTLRVPVGLSLPGVRELA